MHSRHPDSHRSVGFPLSMTIKQRFNRRYPYWRLCLASWCWRGQVYNNMCYKHNR